eukprot:14594701-Heterocapsa_arctica.AAC.1
MALQAMTCVALKSRCEQIGASVSGLKPDLIGRLLKVAEPLNSCDRPRGQWRWGANGVSSYVHCKLCDDKILNIDKATRSAHRTFCLTDV